MSDDTKTTTPEGRSLERPVGRPAKVVAWKGYVRGWGDKPQTVTMATTRGRAISRNLASAKNAGYGLKWGDFRVVRSPEHDGMFDKHGLFSWDFDHAQAALCADVVQRGAKRPRPARMNCQEMLERCPPVGVRLSALLGLVNEEETYELD